MTSRSSASTETVLFSAEDIERTLKRLAHEIVEANSGSKNLVIVGILSRGKPLGERIAALISDMEQQAVPQGYVDITLYRDDTRKTLKPVQGSDIPVDITGRDVVLVDDVLYSGRTIRAALDALKDYGRPNTIQLAVLLDRGHRQLPISPDFVGKRIETLPNQRVNVRLKELDHTEAVTLQSDP
ncbi:MAG: bifunctional pyr operon transcriptional regulator/uracil phosphoribosyltransferase PyrR [Cyanobacteria bacterium HKST-UBA06]|nr:bifunctional pyr operon transcriptional regulator/uracil phosphoribosyltransferase PyrR [Cyanobacteria bacterium HKST-UBA04]MCA9806598.1 bifunctional pyr operon transcriptional regulator/uracil phosphoribosyltransferase PyrR [Cyanobacteria bacterium HKST-UBA06]MCA9840904.1 bifunctional pyr operon transcriptional regulator/uracil phosphoribosyltransferase PyrR [Cyanobacteria bacterium HKST-UBA03]